VAERHAKRSGLAVGALAERQEGAPHPLAVVVGSETPELEAVAGCVKQQAAGWYLGEVMPDSQRRLSFPFHLKPREPKPQVQRFEFARGDLIR
jgi:hypothetical protein